MSRVLLLAATTGYQTRVFADAANQIGLDLVMATDRCHMLEDPWGDHAIAVRFEKPEAAARRLSRLTPRPNGVVAVGDRPTLIAALTAQRLGLRYSPPDAVIACRDKYISRERFHAAGLPVPEYYRLPLDTADGSVTAPYPCVLKPLGLSASRGVIRANDPSEFRAAFDRIRAILSTPEIRRLHEDRDQFVQVESFIPGREFAIEGVVTAGRLKVLAVFDKPDPLDGPFFEETIYTTPSREPAEVQAALEQATQKAVTALGLVHGPVHAEMRFNRTGVWMLEVAARPIGGLCAQSLRFDRGMPLEELVLRHAVGEDVSRVQRETAASGVMMIPIPKNGIYRGVEGEDRAAAVPNMTNVVITAKEGQRLLRLPEGNSYLGFLFARAESADLVERALRSAHAQLKFDIATELPGFVVRAQEEAVVSS